MADLLDIDVDPSAATAGGDRRAPDAAALTHRFLADLAEQQRREPDAGQLLRGASERLGRLLGASRVYFAELEDEEALVIRGSWAKAGTPTLEGGRRSFSDFGQGNLDAHRRGETMVIRDMAALAYLDDRGRKALAKLGIASGVNVPLLRDGRLVAIFSVQGDAPRDWPAWQVGLTEETAERSWSALERARAEARLRESEEQFRLLAENMPSICWVANADVSDSWYNRRGETFFGKQGVSVADLPSYCHQDDLPAIMAAWERAFAQGRALEMTCRLKAQDGGWRWFLSRAEPVRNAAGAIIRWCGVLTDITDQHDAERRAKLLGAIAEATRSETSSGAILASTAELLGRHLGANRVCYSEMDLDNRTVVVDRAWSDGAEADVVGRHTILDNGEELRRVHGRGLPVVADELAAHPAILPETAKRLARVGLVACIDVPLIKDGRLAAVFHVQQGRPRHWTADEVALVVEVAERTWATLERAVVEEQLRARERDGALLLAWSDQVRDLEDADAILTRTMALLGEHLGASRTCYAEGIGVDGLSFTIAREWTAADAPRVSGRYALTDLDPFIARSHLAGETLAAGDVQADARFGTSAKAYYRRWGIAALIDVPLVRGGGLAAILHVHQAEPRTWTPRELALVKEVADRTWAALERAQSEARLRESEALLAAFMENAPVGMFLKDAEGRYERLNPYMAHALGVSVEEALGRTPAEVIGADPGEQVMALDRLALAGESRVDELKTNPASRLTDALVFRFPIRQGEAPITRTGGFTVDITDRKRAEAELERSREALYQSEKLTALGSLLAGVSHELNNPLSIVVAQAVMLERQASDAKLAERAGKIRKAADRCARIVQTFLAMARHKPPQREQVDLNGVVLAALDLTEYGLRTHGVTVTRELAAGLPPLSADADQLHQVLINLLINAQHAMQEQTGPRRLAVRTGRAADGRLTVEVADNGPGVPAEIRRRIFEPFFTTKAQSAGTGVGLSFSQGLVESHGGSLELLETGEGATFRVTLPLGDAAAVQAAAAAEAAAAVASGGGRTALIVDDEPEIAEALAEFLQLEGYRCETAEGGAQATARLAEGGYDLIVSDLRMPEMDGPALYAWIERRRPDLAGRVVFATGDTLGAPAARFLKHAGRPVLEKPFTPDGVRRLLDELEGAA